MEYQGLLVALIAQFRKEWNQPDLPFYIVQLPNFIGEEPEIPTWAWLRDSQAMALRLPHTGMVATIDVGDPADVHPRKKRPVGERLARLAIQDVYGTGNERQLGPRFVGMKIENSWIVLSFSSAEGLVLQKGVGFEIAGEDRRFHPAQARLEGRKIILEASNVSHPVAARYAWANDPTQACSTRKEILPLLFEPTTGHWPEKNKAEDSRPGAWI